MFWIERMGCACGNSVAGGGANRGKHAGCGGGLRGHRTISARSYHLAILVYRMTGRTTVTFTALKAAAELMESWVFFDGDFSDDDFNQQVSRIVWACSVEPKWSEWIAKHKGCPCAYLDKQWGNSKDDNKLGHQSSDRWLAAQKSGKELVPGMVTATVEFPELSIVDHEEDEPTEDEDAWDEADWQRRYAEVVAGIFSAGSNRDTSADNHWNDRRVELEREKAAATGILTRSPFARRGEYPLDSTPGD
jgi:hypothetical protein